MPKPAVKKTNLMKLTIESIKDLKPSIELLETEEKNVKGGFVIVDDIQGF